MMKKQKLVNVITTGSLFMLLTFSGALNAQTTTGDLNKQADINPGTTVTGGSVRVIDNKGTIKYLQVENGLTILSNTTNDVTTTTWQLGGTLTEDTYIDASGAIFSLDGLDLETGVASTNAVNGEIHDNDATTGGTGWTLLVRDEDSGAIKKLLATDLIQSGQAVFEPTGTAAAIGANTVVGVPVDYSKVSVYRNGAKLIANIDYTLAVDAVTLVDRSTVAVPLNWTLDTASDIIEVHWVK